MKKENKEGVDFVFEQNPALAKIGTEQDYSKYIKTIFPESKIQDIVYHNSDASFKNEGFKPTKPKFDTLNSLEGVYNFSTNKKFVERFGKNSYSIILDIKNPFIEESSGEYCDDMDTPLSEALFKIGKQKNNAFAPKYNKRLKNKDSVINNIKGEDYVEKHPISGLEWGLPKQKLISVFEPSQIHILGSKQDVEEFKKYIKDKNRNDSLENKVISSLFILSIAFGVILTTFNLTGNIVGTSGTAHNFIGIILFLLGISGFFIYKKLRS